MTQTKTINPTPATSSLFATDFASGSWVVQPGRETEFVSRWEEFLQWTRAEVTGIRYAMLLRDSEDGSHFVSLAAWDSTDALLAWRSLPGFAERLTACRRLCDAFQGSSYRLVTAV